MQAMGAAKAPATGEVRAGTCLWNALKRRGFPFLGFSGGGKLAPGRAKDGFPEKKPKKLQSGDQKLEACDNLTKDREPKWKFRLNVRVTCRSEPGPMGFSSTLSGASRPWSAIA
jgi:hypothetical protein